MNKNFMYGIGAVKYKDFTIGYIEKNSFDLGGKKPEAAKIEAEQVQGAPVLVIPQSNGGIAPTFNVIQMNYSNLHKLLAAACIIRKKTRKRKLRSAGQPRRRCLSCRDHGNSPSCPDRAY